MLSDEIILLDEAAADNQEALGKVADQMTRSGAVKTSYKSAVLKREIDFPTGLATVNIGIAMPHTDAEYVNYDQLGVLRLREPVSFFQMGDGERIQVRFVFMLALKETHAQLAMLQKLIALIQDKASIRQLLLAEDTDEIIDTLNNVGIE
ncbi:PTS sugar transporter subunit IIA [Weissella fangxianensis]|uniref:PTS sugar transporter subunit IIA n=1 Tax=Weissella fangxianensis TaxID=2953879 RepID=UPI0021586349|nr:PTS sugar transporter subunit IIA [Weissella fangxianensis]